MFHRNNGFYFHLQTVQDSELFLCLTGECYLTDWTVWSPCQLSCVNGKDQGFGSVQVRSRAVVAQDPENLLECPEQELEAKPCTGVFERVVQNKSKRLSRLIFKGII